METFIVFDNSGKTEDRYTVVNKESGDVYGLSANPFAPDGCCYFVGNCAQSHILLYGTGWRERLPSKKVLKGIIDSIIIESKLDPDWIGAMMEFDKLPEVIKKQIGELPETRSATVKRITSASDHPLKEII
ncbi:MAG TPA: hypothetical protein VFV08_14150 [Puia sp.]|nr:hypothetical protein [Puia sp.]